MNDKTVISWVGTGLTFAGSVINSEIRDIISWVVTLVVALVTLGFTIWSWYKKAKSDGKITQDEVEELIDKIKDTTKKGDDNE